jgi:hypothetical protein
MKHKHEWVIHQRSKRCVICGIKDKNYGLKNLNRWDTGEELKHEQIQRHT